MRARTWGPVCALLGLLPAACSDEVPTAHGPDLIPVEAETFELRLPFGEVARDLRVFGGFGTPADMELGLVGLDRPEGFEARTLLRFGPYPESVTVEDESGETQADSSLTYLAGRVVLRMDTTSIQGEPPFQLELDAVQSRWDPRSASWTMAVDTLGDRDAWEEPGGGPARPVAEGEWNPAEADSLVIAVDSATVAEWRETDDPARGLRIRSTTPGSRLRLRSAALQVDVEPSVNPDTTVTVRASGRDLTFVYAPEPEVTDGGIRVGGAPSQRTVFRLELPPSIQPPERFCARIACPLELTPELVVFASVLLESRETEPAGLQPADTLLMEVRPVLEPSRLPRSPLGEPAQSSSTRLDPPLFGEQSGSSLEVPITLYIRDLLEARQEGREDFPTTLALLSAFEPSLPGVATFARPGEEGGPELRLLITVTEGVRLP